MLTIQEIFNLSMINVHVYSFPEINPLTANHAYSRFNPFYY